MPFTPSLFGGDPLYPPAGSERRPRCVFRFVSLSDPTWRAACAREFVTFDLETTGLVPDRDEVVEIAALRFVDGALVERFATLVKPSRPIPAGATAVHGIGDADVEGSPPFAEALPRFLAFKRSAPLVGHNISFDLRFIEAACLRLGLSAQAPAIDTVPIAQRLFPTLPNHKLGTLARHLGIVSTLHRAEADAFVCARILQEDLARRQAG